MSLYFSDFPTIFYAFYKIQHLHPRSRRNRFTNRSSDFADRHSGRKLRLQLGPGAMAGGGSSILVRGRLGSAGKGRGSGVGSPRVPFRGLLAAEEQPAAVIGGARLRRLLEETGRRGWLQ
jgi:hypothetical protein